MIWGCTIASGVGKNFYTREHECRYLDIVQKVLEPSIVKSIKSDTPKYYCQQPNAPCHKFCFLSEHTKVKDYGF